MQLLADDSAIVGQLALQLVRTDTGSRAPYELDISNSAWSGGLVLQPDQARELLAAFQGLNLEMPKPPQLLARWDTTSMSDLTPVDQAHGNPHPEYPRELENGRISGHVFIQFDVDTTGRAELPSVVLLKSSHPLFALAVRNVLRKMKFIPATLHGRKVRETVQMPFDFAVP